MLSLETPLIRVSDSFCGGQLIYFYNNWRCLTEDEVILGYVQGVKLDFVEFPVQVRIPKEIYCSEIEKQKIDIEVQKFLGKGIIFKTSHSNGEFISQIFPRDKKSGGVRIVLNLS